MWDGCVGSQGEQLHHMLHFLCTVQCRGGGMDISAALCWLFPFFSLSSSFPPFRRWEDLQNPGPLAGQGTVLREQRDGESKTSTSTWRHTKTEERQLLPALRVLEVCWSLSWLSLAQGPVATLLGPHGDTHPFTLGTI